jgi:flagellar basal-body rod protein FlgC
MKGKPMSGDFATSLYLAAAGMRAQSGRMRVIAENLANADSTSPVQGGDPYRRRVVTMKPDFDRELGATSVELGKPVPDMSDFRMQYDPGNPAADRSGYVRLPNVNALVEMMDMKDAQRSYEANLQMLDAARAMMARTVDLLRR